MTEWQPVVVALIGIASTLLGTVLGWMLNSLSDGLRFRRERKHCIARVLYVLLPIRYRLKAISYTARTMADQLGLDSNNETVLISLLETSVLSESGGPKDLDVALGDLAKYDPVLAARTRSRCEAIFLLGRLRQLVAANPNAASLWTTMEEFLASEGLPRIEKGIVSLANLHGRRLKRDVLSDLESQVEIPADMLSKLTAQLRTEITTLAGIGAAQDIADTGSTDSAGSSAHVEG